MPKTGFRTIILIDGDLIVDTCLKEKLGVDNVEIPILYEFIGFNSEN